MSGVFRRVLDVLQLTSYDSFLFTLSSLLTESCRKLSPQIATVGFLPVLRQKLANVRMFSLLTGTSGYLSSCTTKSPGVGTAVRVLSSYGKCVRSNRRS
jgi:hypothetical protein